MTKAFPSFAASRTPAMEFFPGSNTTCISNCCPFTGSSFLFDTMMWSRVNGFVRSDLNAVIGCCIRIHSEPTFLTLKLRGNAIAPFHGNVGMSFAYVQLLAQPSNTGNWLVGRLYVT